MKYGFCAFIFEELLALTLFNLGYLTDPFYTERVSGKCPPQYLIYKSKIWKRQI